MVTGNEIVAGNSDRTVPQAVESNLVRMTRHGVGIPGRIMVKLRRVFETRVPVGYEDEDGFHYGADSTGWFFVI